VKTITVFVFPRNTVANLQVQFGHVVRQKRLQAELSQEALSAASGLHRTYVGLLERGLRMPSILVAKKIAEALGTTMGELLSEVDRETSGKSKSSTRPTPR
jgi:transcriptional regulator with XRE-family HTH domain